MEGRRCGLIEVLLRNFRRDSGKTTSILSLCRGRRFEPRTTRIQTYSVAACSVYREIKMLYFPIFFCHKIVNFHYRNVRHDFKYNSPSPSVYCFEYPRFLLWAIKIVGTGKHNHCHCHHRCRGHHGLEVFVIRLQVKQ